MKTQSTVFPDVTIPRPSTDGRAISPDEGGATHLEERFRGIVDAGKQMVETGKARANRWKGGIQDGIREKPLQYVLVAAAAGALLGILLGRRSRTI